MAQVICNRVDQQESIETNSKPSEGVEEYWNKSQFTSESEHLSANSQ